MFKAVAASPGRPPGRSLPGAYAAPIVRLAVLIASAVAIAGVLCHPAASAQTAADVESRDALIAEQEALLNVYRCMFGVDTGIVPGGCSGGVPAVPVAGPDRFPGAPSAAEIARRDRLVADQEALLNVYRCMFGVDTQVVPGGCVAGRPFPAFTSAPPPGVPAFAAVDAGGQHTCAIRSGAADGPSNAVCWGNPSTRQVFPPAGRYDQIASGGLHSCAIRVDRTVACWGWPASGRADAPGGQFAGIAAGANHSCGIRADRSIACWGSNRHGQTDAPGGRYASVTAGSDHSCAIRDDQTVVCWGSSEFGQTDAPAGRFREVSARGLHSCAIGHDWTVDCWGFNGGGQADPPDGQFARIATGLEHTCAIRADWAVDCWGFDSDGQAAPPQGRFAAITAAAYHTCAIRTDRTVECWGRNDHGQAEVSLGSALIPIQAVYAVPSNAEPVPGREQAIAHDVSVAQRWFRSQTGGKHPIFRRDGTAISVQTLGLPAAALVHAPAAPGLYREIRRQLGAAPNSPLLVFIEGEMGDRGTCGWSSFSRVAVVPIGNCLIAPQSGSAWPGGSSYVIAHELAHLLGAAEPCAPNYDPRSPSHVTDSRSDLLFAGPESRDWANLVLDYGNDDYYLHGRDDCWDIARNPLLAGE